MREHESGREAEFLRLFGLYGPALRRLSAAYLQNKGDQEDLLQEIAGELWAALPRFRGASSERTWLYRIAHNVACSCAKKRHRQYRTELQADELPESPSDSDDHRRYALVEAVRQLGSIDRQIVVLYLEGLTAREIEEITGLSANSIGVRLNRARRKLSAIVTGKEMSE